MPRLLAAGGPAVAAHREQSGALPEILGPELISFLDTAPRRPGAAVQAFQRVARSPRLAAPTGGRGQRSPEFEELSR